MTKQDYIDKITKNLEHLTKDELKDVSILTTAQYDVRLKVAEKEYIEKEIANLTPQLQQQALPVVPECVGKWIEKDKNYGRSVYDGLHRLDYEAGEIAPREVAKWVFDNKKNLNLFTRAWLDGYTVEKPQMFKLIFPNSTSVLQKDGELNSFADTVYKRYLIENAMTEQEIKSIDERYWQFAVPVEDGE